MGTKAKHDYSPRMRRALFDGLVLAAERKGKTLTEVAADWWEEDWKKAAEVFTKFMPKENHIKGQIDHNLHLEDSETSKRWIEQQMGEIEQGITIDADEEQEEL